MFGFLKKKEVKEESKFSGETLTRAVEIITEYALLKFKFLQGIDILEKKILSEDKAMAKLLLKHKNGTSVEVSVEEYTYHLTKELQQAIENGIVQTWKFEIENIVSNLRKSSSAIEEFDKYRSFDEKLVSITYLGTRYKMPISEVIRFDDKLRDSKLDPVYDDVRLVNENPFLNTYTGRRMNIYQIAIWWNSIEY